MWVKKETCIRKAARELLGVAKDKKHKAKDTWWWNEDVQKAIKEEGDKNWNRHRSPSNMVKYKDAEECKEIRE